MPLRLRVWARHDVGGLSGLGEVVNLHVLRHVLAERCHGGAPLRERMECAASSGSMLPHREPPGKCGGGRISD